MNVIKIFLFLSFLLFGQVHAATISFDPPFSSATLGEVFSLNIIGTGFSNSPDGGGIDLSFDKDVLNILSVSIDESVWDFGGFGIRTGTIDNTQGVLQGIMVNTFSNVGTSFTVATIKFQAVGLGVSDILLNEFNLNPWASGGSAINPVYVSSSVTVEGTVVPVPAAVWLFSSGLIGLIGIARRKKS